MRILKFFTSVFKSKKIKDKSKKNIKPKKTNPKKALKKPPTKAVKTKKVSLSLKGKKTKEKQIGVITHYFDRISVGAVKLTGSLSLADKIHIKGKRTDFIQEVSSMQFNHKDITKAKKGLEVGIKVIQRVYEGDKVYKICS